MSELNKQVHQLLDEQIREWPLAEKNFGALRHIASRTVETSSFPVVLQYNAERIRSSAAKVDAAALSRRPCFLCPRQLPPEQRYVPFGTDYRIMVNPYPIFPEHLTIPAVVHTPQRIGGRIADMVQLAGLLDDFVVFYNGPLCGASAPDHMHFQAGNKGVLPAERLCAEAEKETIRQTPDAVVYRLPRFQRSSFLIRSTQPAEVAALFNELYALLPVHEGEEEPMMNILCWQTGGEWQLLLIPRQQLRPSCYYAEDGRKRLVSPASVEMGGLFVLPREEDFRHISAAEIEQILDEVCLNEEEIQSIISKFKLP